MAPAHLRTITDTATFRERIALPPGAIATIKLVDDEVLAGVAVDVPGIPTEFNRADPAFIGDPDQLFIWAALRSEVGMWGTTELVPVDEANTVLLTKIED